MVSMLQIIVADLNQPTGVVLSSMSSQMRSRGRPPIYAAAAVAIQQQQQAQEHEQQGSVVLVPATQVLFINTFYFSRSLFK